MHKVTFLFEHPGCYIQCENLILEQNTYVPQILCNKGKKGTKYDAKNKSCVSYDRAN